MRQGLGAPGPAEREPAPDSSNPRVIKPASDGLGSRIGTSERSLGVRWALRQLRRQLAAL
eukprot:3121434-Pyramimonas_sp.AAC.1